MLDAFADVLATADRVVIADIWAGRDPDTTITSAAALAAAVDRALGGCPRSRRDRWRPPRRTWATSVVPGDVVLVMGGGRSYVIAETLVAALGAAQGPPPRLVG